MINFLNLIAMSKFNLYIKNMVCNRCIEAVQEELDKLDIPVSSIKLGEVALKGPVSKDEICRLKEQLQKRGFELLEDKNRQLLEQIKALIIDSIHHQLDHLKANYSTYIEKEVGRDYSYLSNLFSSVEGITIERYIILQKLEKVKELLIYDELNLSQIAYRVGYSSVQHLSNQFKKNTGLTPSEFKKLQDPMRRPIDKIK